MSGITSRVLFPRCGITYADVVSVAGVNKRRAAIKLGIAETHFTKVINRLGMGHWFPDLRPRQKCITREDIVQVASEGYTRRDAAYILGISYKYLKDLIKEWGLQDVWLVRKGKASWVTRRGYCN